MAGLKKNSRLAVLAAVMLAAFVAQLPGAFAQSGESSSPTGSAPTATFDPLAPGVNSRGVAYPDPKHPSRWLCYGRHATIVGTSHNDRLYGTAHQDVIVGLGGNDLISSGQKNDRVCAGPGDDQVYGLGGNDFLEGSSGNDTIFGGDMNDKIHGDGGDDTLNGEGGTDYLYGAKGRDTIYGGDTGTSTTTTTTAAPVVAAASDTPSPTPAPATSPTGAGGAGGTAGLGADSYDYLFGGPDPDTLAGGDGNDNAYGEGGNDTLQGDDGNDRMVGGPGRDTFDGGTGNDTMAGKAKDDTFYGGEGNDTAYGDGGKDAINGNSGRDTLHGGKGTDLINGEGPDETSTAGASPAATTASQDADSIYGDDGNDTICGGTGTDTAFGGKGDDLISGDGSCDWSPNSIVSALGTDTASPVNLIDGGEGTDACVSPSKLVSSQTKRCEVDGVRTLTIEVPSPGGTVAGLPPDILGNTPYCDNSISTAPGCYFYYPIGAVVTLTATPTTALLKDWTGTGASACSTALTCVVTLNTNAKVQANFVAPVSLTVNHTAGPGTITSAPAGISVGIGPASGSANFPAGSNVTLTVVGSATRIWTVGSPATVVLGCTPADTFCTVNVNSAPSTVSIATT